MILDLGCGDRPRKGADVLVDKFPYNPKHRSGREIGKFGKRFVAADAGTLPFRKDAFDFCYCHHAIEHMRRPENALWEMDRVAKAGRIEAPHLFYEFIRCRPNHYWLVTVRSRRLVLMQKKKEEYREKPLFESSLLFKFPKLLIEITLTKLGLWVSDYGWKDRLYFTVIYNDGTFYTEKKEDI